VIQKVFKDVAPLKNNCHKVRPCGFCFLKSLLVSCTIALPGSPVSSDVCFESSDFQSVSLDLRLVKPNLPARDMCAPVKHQAVTILVELEFLAA
jgi:hypothetical protein